MYVHYMHYMHYTYTIFISLSTAHWHVSSGQWGCRRFRSRTPPTIERVEPIPSDIRNLTDKYSREAQKYEGMGCQGTQKVTAL